MRLVETSHEITEFPKDALERIERAGRVCYKSEDRITPGSASEFVRRIMGRGHLAVIEHVHVTVRMVVDRGVSHELVRHRLANYCQESTHYCDYGKGDHVTFVIPPWCREAGLTPGCHHTLLTQDRKGARMVGSETVAALDAVVAPERARVKAWMTAMAVSEQLYRYLRKAQPECATGEHVYEYLRKAQPECATGGTGPVTETAGWSPAQARSVLPNSLKTEVVITANLREWLHIFHLRTSARAHPSMRDVMRPICADFRGLMPEVFNAVEW